MSPAGQKFGALLTQLTQAALNEGLPPIEGCCILEWMSKDVHAAQWDAKNGPNVGKTPPPEEPGSGLYLPPGTGGRR